MLMANEVLGVKFNILGYISMGEMVPDVRITFLYFSKRGFVAMEASKQ
jgi:hypothetical protein